MLAAADLLATAQRYHDAYVAAGDLQHHGEDFLACQDRRCVEARRAFVVVPIHVFSTLNPPTCEVCGRRWTTVDDALRERCEVRRAA